MAWEAAGQNVQLFKMPLNSLRCPVRSPLCPLAPFPARASVCGLSACITVAVRIMACHIMYYGVFYLLSIKMRVSLGCAYKLPTK